MSTTHTTEAAGSSEETFEIIRTLKAPRELVFRAWTEQERLNQWWGPKDFPTDIKELDLRPGGFLHYHMRLPNGTDMWGKWVIREVKAPERLVFVVSFADAQAQVTRSPFSKTWPIEMLSTLTLTEEGGGTKLKMVSVPINANEVERKTFAEGRESMTKGWGGTLEQLEKYLASAAR